MNAMVKAGVVAATVVVALKGPSGCGGEPAGDDTPRLPGEYSVVCEAAGPGVVSYQPRTDWGRRNAEAVCRDLNR